MLNYSGAGVLLYYVDDKTKDLFVYLGMRRNNPDRGKWSILGGGYSYKDKGNLKKTALREFREESGYRLYDLKYLKSIWKISTGIFNFEVFGLKCKHKIPIKRYDEIIIGRWFNVNDLPDNCQFFVKSQVKALRRNLECAR